MVGALGRGGIGNAGAFDDARIISREGLVLDNRNALDAVNLANRCGTIAENASQGSAVADLLETGQVVGLRGPSGVGKTAIANEMVQRLKSTGLLNRFPDGII